MSEMELDRRLAEWAAARRLSDADMARVRERAVRATVVVDAAPGFEADWLWYWLRPVTDLMEHTAGLAEFHLSRRSSLSGETTNQPYLRLA